MNEYIMFWKRAFDFSGRSRRREFWIPWAIHAFGGTLIWLLSLILFSDILFITMCIVSLAGIVPGIAISVRRLHDLGYSGAWLLIWLLPFGGVILLIAHFMDGNIGPNRYGEDPKGRTPVTLQGNA